jgi:hypothetical protein
MAGQMTESAVKNANGRVERAHPRPPSSSARQTGSWYGQADDEALWFPVLGDFSSKLACNRCPDQKFTESLFLLWRCDGGPSMLGPDYYDVFAVVCTVDLNLPLSRGKRAMLCGIRCELVK